VSTSFFVVDSFALEVTYFEKDYLNFMFFFPSTKIVIYLAKHQWSGILLSISYGSVPFSTKLTENHWMCFDFISNYLEIQNDCDSKNQNVDCNYNPFWFHLFLINHSYVTSRLVVALQPQNFHYGNRHNVL
jgi:hypothetical protein